MEFRVIAGDALEQAADVMVVGVCANEGMTPFLSRLSPFVGGAIADAFSRNELEAKACTGWNANTVVSAPFRRVLLMGLGPRGEVDLALLRRVAGQAIQHLERMKADSALWVLPEGLAPLRTTSQAITEGTLLGWWQFEGYKSHPLPRTLPRILLNPPEAASVPDVEAGIKRGTIVAESQNLTRELGWRPSNYLYPERFAQIAYEQGQKAGLEVEVFDPQRLAELHMGGILGVGQGSVHGPRMVILRYAGEGSRTLALVGKGITFDSGGISLKPAQGMDEMKYDMLGAGAVFGAMCAIAALKPKVQVIGILALAQNMPSGSSYKPGDVVTAFNGKSIEILNTDAEGRVALADAVSYAVHLQADWIVEASTLTGAALVALGHEASAMVATDQGLADIVRGAGASVGERIWQLPAYPEFKTLYASKVADMNNAPGRDAGTITAGMIVSEFAGTVPFVHLDIAGTAWTDEGPLNAQEGATGVMVRTFVELAEVLAGSGGTA